MAKKLNRNPFNEKLIHRYLLEQYYFTDRGQRNKLLPERFHKKDINLIVPEENTPSNYRADLSIYFKGQREAVPVEVKWTSSSFSKPNQTKYLYDNGGFLVAFDDDVAAAVDTVKIDQNDFTSWVSKNASKLVRESLSQQVSGSEYGKQYWIVYLVGGAFNNFHKMYGQYAKNPFWAFKQNRTALRNILDIQKGDKLLFVLGKSDTQAMINDPKKPMVVKEWYECTVKEPYFMNLGDEAGNFFESASDLPISDRKWPHFLSFNIDDQENFTTFINLGKRDVYARPFAESVNYGGGVPASISRKEFEMLLDIFHNYQI